MLNPPQSTTDGLWHRRRLRRSSTRSNIEIIDQSNDISQREENISVNTIHVYPPSSPSGSSTSAVSPDPFLASSFVAFSSSSSSSSSSLQPLNWSTRSSNLRSPVSTFCGCLMVATTCLSVFGSTNASPTPSPTGLVFDGGKDGWMGCDGGDGGYGGGGEDGMKSDKMWDNREVVGVRSMEQRDVVTITTTKAASHSSTNSPSLSTTSSLPTAPTSSIPFPDSSLESSQIFDTTLSFNLTDSCVSFFSNFLQDGRMKVGYDEVGGCLSWGLVMRTSSEWLKIATNTTLLNAALSDICHSSTAAPGATILTSSSLSSSGNGAMTCSAWFSQLSIDIQKKGNCASDLTSGNAVANQALNAFQNYDIMQKAACLTDPQTNVYCYLEAVSILTNDAYLYNLPLGTQLLPTVTPTCSKCSQALLSVYATAIHDGTAYAPALKNALTNATTLVNNQCGQNWVTYVSSTSAGEKRWNVGWMELGLTGFLVVGSLVGVGWTL